MSAKILFIDIETAPMLVYTWGIWEQNIGLNQIVKDSHLLSFAAKWLDKPEMYYADQRNARSMEYDKPLLKQIWNLLNEADIVIGHNSKEFDTKVVNTRFIINGMQPPSTYKQIDTKELTKKSCRFVSNKLEYLSDQVCEKHKKHKHHKFSGFELWKECLAGNMDAWDEMEKYNKIDVLALEELYLKMQPWGNTYNPDLYTSGTVSSCTCGCKIFTKKGFRYTAVGKYQAYKCTRCGAKRASRTNLMDKNKRDSLRN